MSYSEYYSMFKKAQKKDCKYRMFVFDVAKHRYLPDQVKFFHQMNQLLFEVTNDIMKLEKEQGKEILNRDEGIVFRYPKQLADENGKFDLNSLNPGFSLGDLMWYSVYNNSISEKDFLDIFQKNYHKLKLDFDFHYATGLYETNLYEKGHTLYFRGYCIPQLEEISKTKPLLFASEKQIRR